MKVKVRIDFREIHEVKLDTLDFEDYPGDPDDLNAFADWAERDDCAADMILDARSDRTWIDTDTGSFQIDHTEPA